MNRDDSLSSDGAHHLAARIREYWREQGYAEPEIRIETIRSGGKYGNAVHMIRSDMLDGFPRAFSTNGTGQPTILPGKSRLTAIPGSPGQQREKK